jgi:putative ABC transport system ATP-binding protein
VPKTKPAAQAPIVAAKGVHKTYETGRVKVHALDNVDFEVMPGEIVGVMGPSGCGKTTLLNCLSGLDEIDSGSIRVEGLDLAHMGDNAKTRHRAKRMGFIFQSFNLLPVLTAVENVELPLLVSGRSTRAARQRAVEALQRVGLGHRLDHKPKELSGGEQQRVAVARSIVNDPAIVWADEPTGNLDSQNSRQIMDLIVGLNKDMGQTYVVVTHSPEVAALCDRVVWMLNGAIDTKPRSKLGKPAR